MFFAVVFACLPDRVYCNEFRSNPVRTEQACLDAAYWGRLYINFAYPDFIVYDWWCDVEGRGE